MPESYVKVGPIKSGKFLDLFTLSHFIYIYIYESLSGANRVVRTGRTNRGIWPASRYYFFWNFVRMISMKCRTSPPNFIKKYVRKSVNFKIENFRILWRSSPQNFKKKIYREVGQNSRSVGADRKQWSAPQISPIYIGSLSGTDWVVRTRPYRLGHLARFPILFFF